MNDDRPRLEGCDPTEFADPYPAWKEARDQGLQRLLARLPGLRLVREPAYPAEYVSAVQVRGPRRLELAWDVRDEPLQEDRRTTEG